MLPCPAIGLKRRSAIRALFVGLLIALGVTSADAQGCKGLHSGQNWIIVAKGDEAVEYEIRSRDPSWRIMLLTDEVISCDRCGLIALYGTPYRGLPSIQHMKGLAEKEGAQVGEETPIELGLLKGAAIRLRGFTGWDMLAIEADDGCVHLLMAVSVHGSLDGSPFRDPRAVAEATAVEVIPRGRVANLDIRCLKSTLHASFEAFERWAFPPPPPPVEVPSFENFRKSLESAR
jgi:hypothetical protein